MKKIDIRVKRTYDQLVDSMMELLTVKDLEEISVSEICSKAGVHRATFYKHFNDKFEFINYCFENQLSTINFDDKLIEPTPENLSDALWYFVKEVFTFVDKNFLLISAVCSNKYFSSLGTSFISALTNFSLSKFMKVLNVEEYKLEILSTFYSSAFIGVVKWYVEKDGNYKEDIMRFLDHRINELVAAYKKST